MNGANPFENVCVIVHISGLFNDPHDVRHLKTFSLAETATKKADAKRARAIRTAQQVASLAEEARAIRVDPELAASPAAAAMADELSPANSNAAFARMYGAQDARDVARSNDDTEFELQYALRNDEGGDEDVDQ
jgi:hypothetical protein